MSANEKTEAVLIVIKRLLKWLLSAGLALVAVVAASLGYEAYEKWHRNKPGLLTEYAELKLSDSPQQVRYVLGNPPEFLHQGAEEPGNPWSKYPRVIRADDDKEGHLISESKGWQYASRPNTRLDVEFDKPGGVVSSISCYSQTIYACPQVFGIHDGTDEEEVLGHLGKPDAAVLRDSSKVLRYNRYNLTLYLVKKKVYMLEVTAAAPAPAS